MMVFKIQKSKQTCWVWCPYCGIELTKWGTWWEECPVIHYRCPGCGAETRWLFDTPTPVYLNTVKEAATDEPNMEGRTGETMKRRNVTMTGAKAARFIKRQLHKSRRQRAKAMIDEQLGLKPHVRGLGAESEANCKGMVMARRTRRLSREDPESEVRANEEV